MWLTHSLSLSALLFSSRSQPHSRVVVQELEDVAAGKAFGASLDLNAVRQTLTPDTLVPGVAVYRCGCGRWMGCCASINLHAGTGGAQKDLPGRPRWPLSSNTSQSPARRFLSQPNRASPSLPTPPTPLHTQTPDRSRRADPLAAWTDSLDLAAVVADTDRAFLILETGFSERWRYGAYRRTLETTAEATAWEAAKQAVG